MHSNLTPDVGAPVRADSDAQKLAAVRAEAARMGLAFDLQPDGTVRLNRGALYRVFESVASVETFQATGQ